MKDSGLNLPTTEATRPDTAELYTDYPVAGGYDEMHATDGTVRPHWQYLAGALNDMGRDELRRRKEEAWRLIRENDVTYNLYSEPRGMGRPWQLDLVPQLIGSDEWQSIELALTQRAELFNLLMQDFYSERTLVRKRVIPPEILYAHPGFLVACHRIPLRGHRALPLYSADIVRGREGGFEVISDRAQAPSGAGYALENRLVVSRVLPSLFRDAHTHRLANYFRAVRQALTAMAPHDEEPNIVLLSPGPANEAYFEHAYLASYLGYTLVEGGDLTVRDNRVWLSTLDGLRPVDVILRRMDDSYSDPVELREDSFLGVPGMTNVARLGNVSIANPLGSGVLESPALLPYLPKIAKYLLGEELRLPSVQSWWCGDSKHCKHVLANLPRMVIKMIHPSLGFRFRFGADLDRKALAELKDRIKARPWQYIGQDTFEMSTVPVLGSGGLEPRHTVLRTFLAAGEGDYKVMPGGLTRVSASNERLVVSNQAGGISKDTWVLATEPEKHVSLLSERRQARYAPDMGGEVSGRVADNLFWVGRYAERAEFVSRLLRLTLQFVETGESAGTPAFVKLLQAVTHQTVTYPGFSSFDTLDQVDVIDRELLSVMSDTSRSGSLCQTLSSLLLSARSVRDQLSSDTWRVINDIDDELDSLGLIAPEQLVDALDELDNLINALTAFSGLTMENMLRGRSWMFLDIGRRLERGLQITRLLRSTIVPASASEDESLLADSLLTIVDSLMSYRRRYRYGIKIPELLELVVSAEINPRSLAYQLGRLEEHVSRLPQKQHQAGRSELERLALETATMVRLADFQRLAQVNEDTGSRDMLEQFLVVMSQRLPEMSDALTAAYFRTTEAPHQLVRLRSL